ncbi:MAG: hypothetical protein WBM54_05785 [Woeseia sp.]
MHLCFAYTVRHYSSNAGETMSCHRQYDTVAFDVRDHAMMLFFARTKPNGDIDDYLLLMRGESEDFGPKIYLEINEQQYAGHDLIREVEMCDNVLTLYLREPAEALGGANEIVLSYAATADNKAVVEAGAMRVLGDCLSGGHA